MHVSSIRCFIILVYLITIQPGISSFAQGEPEYDEISIFLDIPRMGGREIDAIIKGQEVFLPVTDLFDFLKIRNVPSSGLDTIAGFFINQEAAYHIDRVKNLIRFGEELFELKPGDLIRTESNLYLRAYYYGKIFGLDCIFDFRNLSVTINTKLELPIIREMRQEEMRKNLTRLKGEMKADTAIGRSYPLFHFGMADWSAIATEQINGPAETRLNLTLGSIIAGGETTASLYYDSKDPITEKQQHYLWRYVNNDNNVLRQVMAGKIATRATSSIYNPVVGVQVTNTPTTFRRSFGSYTLSDKTEPGWIVELYVNNVLVDYVKADASGFFTFEVPLVYGNSIVRLKFYGPWGEERTSERNISIPFNFIPKNTLEYTISAGMVEDTLLSRFSRSSINYGLTRGVTIGAGYEYLSSVSSGSFMPFVNASLRLASNLLFSGEYTHTVRAKGTLTYRLPSNLQLDLYYTKYAKDQKAINYNYREERKASISIPIRLHNFSAYNRLTVNQLVLPAINYTTGEWLLSGSLFRVNTNITTYALFIGNTSPYVYTNLSLSFRFPAGFTIIPQAQYGFTDNELLSTKLGLEKHLFQHGFLNLSYEQNYRSNLHMGELGFRYDFKFAQTGFSTRQTDKLTTLVQYARGSLINDRKTGYLGTDNRVNVGRGGITIIPYIDKNANGKREPGEQKAFGLNLRASGGRIERSEKDTTIRILSLEPYTDCYIEFDQGGFDNVAWRLKNRTMSVAVDPNMLKLIEIPIIVVGEASGMVSIDRQGKIAGLARMIVNFYSKDQKQIARTLTEEDGYFTYFGLNPGAYNVRVDTIQLRRLGMISTPDSIDFNIIANIEGDFVEGLNFLLHIPGDTIMPEVPEVPVVKKDTTYMIIHEVTEELVSISEDSYAIQLGAFKVKSNAEASRSKLQTLLGKKVGIIIEGGFYKVRINEIKDRKEVDENIAVLQKNGITELWVISLKAKKQQLVLTERRDTVTTITETITEKPSGAIGPAMWIQLGAFRVKANALALLAELKDTLDKRVIITYENGYFKVRIILFPMLEESISEQMKKLMPSIGRLKIKDIWILPVKTVLMEEPALVRSETTIKPIEWKRDVTALVKPEITSSLVEQGIVAPAAPSEPTWSLQVAVFQKKIQALYARRRIINKLDLPVEIVPEYDYYRVIITGFHTREETFRFYPELAGLGYDKIYLIEKKK